MLKKFNSTSKLLKLILLLIPGVNWVTELLVRAAAVLEKKDFVAKLINLLIIIFGLVWGWVDFVWVLLFNHLTFAK